MNDWFKEKRVFENALIKYGQKYEIDAEEYGYKSFKNLKIPTPKVYCRKDDFIVIEKIEGPSLFEVCKLAIKNSANFYVIISILSCIMDDLKLFQEYAENNFYCGVKAYDSNKKLNDALKLLKEVNNKFYSKLEPNVEIVNSLFLESAKIPFRDCTLKNIIVKNIDLSECIESILDGDCSLILKNRCHIDFRSLCEKTTIYDDIISIYGHSIFPHKIIDEFENKYLYAKDKNLDFIITKIIRYSRLWGRRFYYKSHISKHYSLRYSGENIDFYFKAFTQSIEDLIEKL